MWTPKKLSPEADAALHDLYGFLVNYWGLQLHELPHREMCAVIQKAEEEDAKPYTMLVVPRGSYKTSIVRGSLVWKQLRQIYLFGNLYHRIVLASATLALGETSLRVIERQLRYNKKLAADFGKLFINERKKDMSSKDPEGLILAPRLQAGELAAVAEPSFWVASIRRISTGFHADEAFVDDLNNRENVATDTQRKKTQEYFDLLKPIVEPKDRGGKRTRLVMTCTPWHDGDVRGTILRQEKERLIADPSYDSPWNVIHHSAYNEDGTAYFPEKLSLEVLEEYRENMAVNLFSSNYLCDPVGAQGFVDESQILFKSRDTFPPLRWMRCPVDPSQHKQGKVLGCYTALGIIGYDRFANTYVLDLRGSREWTSGDLIDELFQIHDEYPDVPLMIEEVHMAHLDHAIKLEEARRSEDGERHHLRIQWIPTGSESKYQKWEKLQPRFRSGRIIFAEEIDPKIKAEVKEELVRGEAAGSRTFWTFWRLVRSGFAAYCQDGRDRRSDRAV